MRVLVDKIMVAYDGSEHSRKAFQWALALQKMEGSVSTVDVVMVMPALSMPQVFQDEKKVMAAIEKQKETMEREMAKLVETEDNQQITTHILESNTFGSGTIAQILLKYAVKNGVGVIVTGTRGLGGFEGLLLGSVASQLVTYADVPVFVVK
ncbi:MAG: universal stress protein [Selenomonadaceae bacterium]